MTRNNGTVKESYLGQDGRMRVLVQMDQRTRQGDVIVKLERDTSPFVDGQRVVVEDGRIVS